MPTKIGVAIRIRPFLDYERKGSMQMTKLQISPAEKEIRIQNDDMRSYKSFKFDKVLGPETTQEQLYGQTQIQDLVNKVVEGYHSTIFAYGQTGSGKTYTMEGYKYEVDPTENDLNAFANPYSKDAGIIPRSIATLFDSIKSYSKLYRRSYTVYCSFLQIYNEKIYDLLNPAQMSNKSGLRLRWTPQDQFVVENLFVFECRTAEEVLTLFHQGLKNKIMASHKLNLASSRSHCMLSLRVESLDPKTSDNIIISKLDLVDLAGSERASMTGNENQIAQKESIEINKSLFTLRQVIATLADMQKSPSEKSKEKPHIPYRDSKLTCLLKQSIGGNSYCLMIACLAPADRFFEENLSTLTYATKAAYISNEPMRNDDPKTKLISELKTQVSSLSKELEKANVHISFLSQLTNEKLKTFTIDTGGNEKRESNGFRDEANRVSRGGTRNRANSSRQSETGTTKNAEPILKQKTANFTDAVTKLNKQESITPSDKISAIEEIKSPEILNERLIESISTVKELLKSNKEMRDKMDKLIVNNENFQGELYQVHKENQELREKLAVYESLFNTGGGAVQNLLTLEEGITSVEGKLDVASPKYRSPKDKRSKNIAEGLAEEVMNLRRHQRILENKVRENEIENMTLHQKFYPASHLLRGRKKDSGENFQQTQQFYHSVGQKPPYGSKHLPDVRGETSPITYKRAETAKAGDSPKDEPKKPREDVVYRTDYGKFNENKRMSTPEIRNKVKQKDIGIMGYHYLPQLKDNSEISNEVVSSSIIEGSVESMKKTNNVWLSGFIKRRANSTLKKTRNDEKPVNRTYIEMDRVQMFK